MTGITMKHGCKHITAFLSLMLACSLIYGQVSIRASIDKDKILIGEPIMLSVEAHVPLGQQVTWYNADTIPHFEYIQKYNTDTAEGIDGKKISQLVSITSFDSGRWQIPSFEVIVAGKSYFTDSIPVDVSFISFDPAADYRDIKDIEDVVNPSVRYIPWAIGAAALVSLILIIYLLRKRKIAPENLQTVEVSKESPYEEARRALTALRKKGPPASGEEKIYYAEMNDILRIFVLKKFSISTLERTNEELIMQLARLNIPEAPFAKLADALRMVDFVKFAKYRPDGNESTSNLDIISSSIDVLDSKSTVNAV